MKKAAAQPVTDAQLEQALAAARLDMPLGDAMRSPAVARCLEITAEALLNDSDFNSSRPSPSGRIYPTPQPVAAHEPSPRIDVKRAAAGDKDE